MLFPLSENVFTNILKFYEKHLRYIHNKIPKNSQALVLAIIIYQVNSMAQLCLVFKLFSS